MKRYWYFVVGTVLLTVLAAMIVRPTLDGIESQVTALRYAVRGTRQADTNIVIVYVDQEAIKTLGWPVRRNFYALMVKALSDLQVSVIGLEPVFEDSRTVYPEYDNLLGSVISSAGNVVLTAYADSVTTSGDNRAPAGMGSSHEEGENGSAFDYPGILFDVPVASGMHLPLRKLREGAAGVGHLNIRDDGGVYLFLGLGRDRIASFGLELARAFTNTRRAAIVGQGTRMVFRHEGTPLIFSSTEPDRVVVNFPGPVGSFTCYPFVEVLRAYDALRNDRPPSLPIRTFAGKIVLVGVIAEGRSEFVRTPVDARYPAIAFHAAFVDNVINDRFLRATPLWVSLFVCGLVAALSCTAVLFLPSGTKRLILVGIPVAIVIWSYLSFSVSSLVFPVIAPLLAYAVSGVAGLLLRHHDTRKELGSLNAEKQTILERLRDREAKVALLEQEITTLEAEQSRAHAEELLTELRRYKAEVRALSSQAEDLDAYEPERDQTVPTPAAFENIVYAEEGAMKPVIGFIAKIAPSEAPVLLLGESGTGKELVARALHRRSSRSAGPFIAVNCGALSESLLESELFGHERGAFTGAVKERAGRFELADKGTIFLDEIGEVSESFQLKLLRVLQEGEFERVGGTKTLRSDVRVVAATNKDLKSRVREKQFREDLYYRLNVLTVALPPLRDRQADIPVLIDHILRRDGGTLRVSRNVMNALLTYAWPGNVRELESVIKRGVLLATAEKRNIITIKDLPEEMSAIVRGAIPVEEQILESIREKQFSRSSVTDTADELGGLNRGTVAEYLRGECLKAFVESTFDFEKAARRISLSPDAEINERVMRRLNDYLENIAEAIAPNQPWETSKAALRPKAKNLPQKYHLFLENVGEAFYRGVWKLSGTKGTSTR
jgi:transcriptional regulator with GAF, ATPase, and Fis domain/CHASE2 domain-containing sensor protein